MAFSIPKAKRCKFSAFSKNLLRIQHLRNLIDTEPKEGDIVGPGAYNPNPKTALKKH